MIFSRWKTRDIANYSLADNGWGQSAGYEGDFIVQGARENETDISPEETCRKYFNLVKNYLDTYV